jgi:hypothetical protein
MPKLYLTSPTRGRDVVRVGGEGHANDTILEAELKHFVWN